MYHTQNSIIVLFSFLVIHFRCALFFFVYILLWHNIVCSFFPHFIRLFFSQCDIMQRCRSSPPNLIELPAILIRFVFTVFFGVVVVVFRSSQVISAFILLLLRMVAFLFVCANDEKNNAQTIFWKPWISPESDEWFMEIYVNFERKVTFFLLHCNGLFFDFCKKSCKWICHLGLGIPLSMGRHTLPWSFQLVFHCIKNERDKNE